MRSTDHITNGSSSGEILNLVNQARLDGFQVRVEVPQAEVTAANTLTSPQVAYPVRFCLTDDRKKLEWKVAAANVKV